MKVTGKTTPQIAKAAKAAKSARGSFSTEGALAGISASAAQGLSGEGQAEDAARASNTASDISALSALIALQADGGNRGRALAHAERMLGLLEALRDGMLTGAVNVQDLQKLADAARAKKDIDDNALAAIYDQIALRARVELAKLRQ